MTATDEDDAADRSGSKNIAPEEGRRTKAPKVENGKAPDGIHSHKRRRRRSGSPKSGSPSLPLFIHASICVIAVASLTVCHRRSIIFPLTIEGGFWLWTLKANLLFLTFVAAGTVKKHQSPEKI